jgi:hypothetical protein
MEPIISNILPEICYEYTNLFFFHFVTTNILPTLYHSPEYQSIYMYYFTICLHYSSVCVINQIYCILYVNKLVSGLFVHQVLQLQSIIPLNLIYCIYLFSTIHS